MSFVDNKRRTFNAGVDLTNYQYCICKLNGSGQVVPSAAATDKHIGVIEQNPTSGDYSAVVRLINGGDGTYHAYAGGTIAIGDLLTSNASGQIVATTTAADQLVGQAVKTAVSGDLVEFLPFRAKF